MALGTIKFGNVTVTSTSELECTVPDCSYCEWNRQGHALCVSPEARTRVRRCRYFVPNSPHIFWQGEWWS